MGRPNFGVLMPGAVLLLGVSSVVIGASTPHPISLLAPGMEIDAADRAALDAGEALVEMMPAGERELAVLAAVRVDAPGDRLIAWMRRIAELQRGRYIPTIARFSDPPRLDDLEALALNDEDLEDIRRCRPGDCGVKLSAREIAQLQQRIGAGGDWKDSVQDGFRRAVLGRAQEYLLEGDFGLPPYYDDRTPVSPDAEFASLVHRLGFMQAHLPDVVEYLQWYPRIEHPDVVESFLYWSTESLGVKPITSVTHVSLTRGGDPRLPEALAISKQVFASHYRDGSISVTAVIGAAESGRYLVYVNRSHVDVLDGALGGFLRRIIERRVREEAPDVIKALRRRLETEDPPT